MNILNEKRKTIFNQKSEIMEARVIANYGDTGLAENFHFDLLSRYIICFIESTEKIPCNDKYTSSIVVVKRPENLWITASSVPNGNPTSQQRMDYYGNISIGAAGSFSTNGIGQITPNYQLGDILRIRKLGTPLQPNNSFFNSAFTTWDETTMSYGNYHSVGSTLPYFTSQAMKNQLQLKTLNPVTSDNSYYAMVLFKLQYEAFMLTIKQGQSAQYLQGLTSIFSNSWNGNPAVFTANGGYVFNNSSFINLNGVAFEDTNYIGRTRETKTQCQPLVIANPSSFITPSIRSVGTIAYTPSYSSIQR